ncbi:MAG: hypothetical protein AABY22_36195 [Nanoarchaeota archaeon]
MTQDEIDQYNKNLETKKCPTVRDILDWMIDTAIKTPRGILKQKKEKKMTVQETLDQSDMYYEMDRDYKLENKYYDKTL